MKSVQYGKFYLEKYQNYFRLRNNFQSSKVREYYFNKNYKHNTPPPNKKGWGRYLSNKQYLNIKKYLKENINILEIGAGSIFLQKK